MTNKMYIKYNTVSEWYPFKSNFMGQYNIVAKYLFSKTNRTLIEMNR